MSLGFGLSLPAYPVRGGGGNNPFNQLGPTLDLAFAGIPTDPLGAATLTDYTLNTNFIVPQYQIAAQYVVWENGVGLVNKNFSDIITFTRASTATYFDSSGVLQSAGNNVPRLDYNPATLAARGLLIEEQRTNSIRNNTMQGAVAGTPGTLPTNWGTLVNTTTGLTTSVVGTGTENGVTYVDIRLNGTATGSGSWDIYFEPASGVAALTGQTWSGSLYWKLQAGSTTGLSAPTYYLYEFTSGIAFIVAQAVNLTFPTGAALNTQRQGGAMTLNGGATTAFARPLIKLNISNGAAIDITLRIGLPQLEQGAFATSVIPTTTTALTRSADVASVNTLAPWYNSTVGTIYVEASNAQVQASLFSTDDGTASNRIITYFNVANSPAFRVVSGGVDQCNYSAGTITQNAAFKLAAAYQVNDFAASLNGAAVVTDTSGTIPTGQTTARIGTNVSLANSINGYLRRITYYPRRLSNAELQTLTT